MKMKHFAIFLIITIFMIGAVSATDSSENLTGTDSSQNISVESLNEFDTDVITEENEIETQASQNSPDSTMGNTTLKELIENEDYKAYIPQKVFHNSQFSIISVKNMPFDAKGNISIYIDNMERYNHEVSVGGNGIYIGDFDYGKHNVLINYTGDNQYAGFIKTGLFETTLIEFYIDQQEYGYGEGAAYCYVALDDGVTGYVKIILDGFRVFSGKYEGLYLDLWQDGIFDTYEVQYYNGNHKDLTISGSIDHLSEEQGPSITIPTSLLVGKTYYIMFDSYDGEDGVLVLSGLVNGSFKVENGSASIPISCQNEGSYSLEVTYKNFTYNEYIEVRDLNVIIYSPDEIYPWSWADSDGDSGPGINVDVYSDICEQPTGTTSIYLNDKLIDTVQGQCNYLIDEEMLWNEYTGPGDYNVTVFYSGDKNFKAVNKTSKFRLSSYELYCENGVVYVSLLSDVSGVLTVKVNGNTIATKKINATYASYASLCDEKYEIQLKELKNDENNVIEVIFNDNCNKCSFTESFNYTFRCPIDLGFLGDGENISYGKNDIVLILPDDAKSKATVTIDGKECSYSKISKNSEKWEFVYDDENMQAFEIDLSDLKPGNHNISVFYSGDSKYSSNSRNQSINVLAEVQENGTTVFLNLPNDAIGNLTIEIQYKNRLANNLSKTVALKEGEASITLPLGSYFYRAYYTGTDYEVNNIDNNQVFIQPDCDYPEVMNYGENKQFKLDKKYNGILVFYIGEYDYSLPVAEFDLNKNNVISINKKLIDNIFSNSLVEFAVKYNYESYGSTFLDLKPVIYTDVGNFDEFYPIEIHFETKFIGFKNIVTQYQKSKTIKFTVYDMFGKLVGKNKVVTLKIGKKTYTAKTNKNSVVTFKTPKTLSPGKYTLKAIYKNGGITKKLTVKHILSLKTVKVKKSSKLVLTAKLAKKLKGKKITFKFNGKKYVAKTNKKGIAKVTIKKSVMKKLKVGKKVTYQATYLKDTVKKSVKVKK